MSDLTLNSSVDVSQRSNKELLKLLKRRTKKLKELEDIDRQIDAIKESMFDSLSHNFQAL